MSLHPAAAALANSRPFLDSYLLAYSAEHVVYEIDMFLGLAVMLGQRSRSGSARAIGDEKRMNNALLEAYGLHLRLLVDFLFCEVPKPTDVIAEDYCAAEEWKSARPDISESLSDARSRANKEFAHLTTARISGVDPKKEWDLVALTNEVRFLLQTFAAAARTAALSPLVARTIRCV